MGRAPGGGVSLGETELKPAPLRRVRRDPLTERLGEDGHLVADVAQA